jgi:hypothetical protein
LLLHIDLIYTQVASYSNDELQLVELYMIASNI